MSMHHAVSGLTTFAVACLLSVDVLADDASNVTVEIDGHTRKVELHAHSVRAQNFGLLVQRADGSIERVDPGPVRTVRGHVVGMPGSLVAGSMLDDGPHLVVRAADGSTWSLEPQAGADAWEISADALCTTRVDAAPPPEDGGVAGSGGLCVAQLACDADFEYFTSYSGSIKAVQERIELVVATMNVQYEEQTAITHEITAIVIRTAEPDPYTTTDPALILQQFRNVWLAEHGDIERDLAKLFTAKNLAGGIVGMSFLGGSICNDLTHYCLSESDFGGTLTCAAGIAAHVTGHLWGATHCECGGTMEFPCVLEFEQQSIDEIVAVRDTSPCLDCAAPCPDTNGDWYIDVIDIVNVFLDWGTDGSENGGDVDGSGVVDVADLVALIFAWGPC